MQELPIQDRYADALAHCYGCGRHNEAGLQLKSVPSGEGTLARFTPRPEHVAVPGFVYGGLIASLIDCHGTGTAAWASEDGEGVGRFVTGSLSVKYLRPTPHGPELLLRASVAEKKAKKVVVDITLEAEGVICATGQVVAVRMPETMGSA